MSVGKATRYSIAGVSLLVLASAFVLASGIGLSTAPSVRAQNTGEDPSWSVSSQTDWWGTTKARENIDIDSDGTIKVFWRDPFEDNDVAEYSENTGYFHTSQVSAKSGSYGLEVSDQASTTEWYRIVTPSNFSADNDNLIYKGRTGTDGEANKAAPQVVFGYQDWNNHYTLAAYPGADTIYLRKVEGGTTTDLDSYAYTLGAEEWYKFKIFWQDNNTITVDVWDNTSAHICQLSGTDSTFTSGKVGFAAGGYDPYWDMSNISVGTWESKYDNKDMDPNYLDYTTSVGTSENALVWVASDTDKDGDIDSSDDNTGWNSVSGSGFLDISALGSGSGTKVKWKLETTSSVHSPSVSSFTVSESPPDWIVEDNLEWNGAESASENSEILWGRLVLSDDNTNGSWESTLRDYNQKANADNLKLDLESVSDFKRPEDNVAVFNNEEHDASFFIDHSLQNKPFRLILYERNTDKIPVYGSDSIATEGSQWTEMADNIGIDAVIADMIKVGDNYLAYCPGTDDVWRSDNLLSGWSVISGSTIQKADGCAYYDPENDLYHWYPQSDQNIHTTSGENIEHYTSPTGFDNWTYQGDVIHGWVNGYGVGDPDVIKVGDWYYMYVDNSVADHPDYNVAVYKNDDLYGEWTFVKNVVKPRQRWNGDSTQIDYYGVQDPTVKYDNETDNFYMYANGHKDSAGSSDGIVYYSSGSPFVEAKVGADTDDDGTADSFWGYNRVLENFASNYNLCGENVAVDTVNTINSDLSGYRFEVDFKLGGSASVDNWMLNVSEVANVAPTVKGTTPTTPIDPNAFKNFKVEVRDNDTLNDLENVKLVLYDNRFGPDTADNERSHYTFLWENSTGFSEVGPGTGIHIDTGASSAGTLTKNQDNFVFNIMLDNVANPNQSWNMYAEVYDNAENSDSLTSANAFSVNVRISYSWQAGGQDSTVNFSGAPGDSDIAEENGPTVSTITSNVNFDVATKLGDNWTSDATSDEIPAENTSFAQTSGGTQTAMSTSYQDVYTDVGYGESLSENIYYYLDVPSDLTPASYSTTFYLEVAEH